VMASRRLIMGAGAFYVWIKIKHYIAGRISNAL
jgi:hypothetical protein